MKKRLVLVPASFIFCAFLLLPLLFMVLCSLHSDLTNQWTLANYSDIFSNKYYTQAFVNSVLIAVSSSVIGLIGTFILCLCLMNLSTKLQEKITFVSNLAANFAGIPLAFSFIILLGNVGVLKMILPFLADFNLYSWWGLTITYTYFQIPLGVLFLYPSMKEVKRNGWSPHNCWALHQRMLGSRWLCLFCDHRLPAPLSSYLLMAWGPMKQRMP